MTAHCPARSHFRRGDAFASQDWLLQLIPFKHSQRLFFVKIAVVEFPAGSNAFHRGKVVPNSRKGNADRIVFATQVSGESSYNRCLRLRVGIAQKFGQHEVPVIK